MQDFTRKDGELFIENCPLDSIADQYGTPCYVYSRAAITRAYNDYADALGEHPGKICYAVKANSNLTILQVLAKLGAGFDIVSIGELERVLLAGGKPERIIFSGVGKKEDEMLRALDVGIACFNVESEAELETLSSVASKAGKTATISIRVNPDVDANTHPYISTGLKENKFGIDIERALITYQRAAELPGIKIAGVDCHIGSQLIDTSPFMDALERLLGLIDQLAESNIVIEHLDLGGGVGIQYRDEQSPNIQAYIDKIKQRIAGRRLELIFEPGRSIVGNSGALLTEVIYLKPGEHKNFAIVDAAMNDNIRPALYQAWQHIEATKTTTQSDTKDWDIVGPICETGDFLAKARPLSLNPGDRLAMLSSGAYGFVMSSNYNSRGRAPEVLVDGENSFIIRERETFTDLVKGEHLLQDEK